MYSVASLLGITLVAVVLALTYRSLALETLAQQHTRANVSLARALANSLFPRYAGFVARAKGLSNEELRSQPETTRLRQEILRKIEGLGVVAVKIYDSRARAVFATDPLAIGSYERDNADLGAALSGEASGGLRPQTHFATGAPTAGKLFSSYVPIDTANGERVVIELYADATEELTELEQTGNALLTVVVGLMFLLYVFLVTIVWRSDRTIRAHQQAERRLREERIQYLAHHDNLTGLPDRAQFTELTHRAVAQALRSETTMAILIIGLDRFKAVNDSLGHEAGDGVLSESAKRLRANMRRGEPVCRIGGDEFAVILERVASPDSVTACAQRLIQQLGGEIVVAGHGVVTSASIGIALCPDDGGDAEKLIKNADAAMRRAKLLGGSRYAFYTRELNERALERHQLEMELRRALEGNEFRLHYQPKVGAASGRIVGMEALLRWHRPGHGLVAPAHFIPVLEESGLIDPVGRWVLREACAQCKVWCDAGHGDLRMSVNLSLQQFQSDTLVEEIQGILEETGLPARNLELELTESVLIRDRERTTHMLDRLRALGLSISVDDFGTGYSSLSYLTQFPVDYLKIDRSFVRDMLHNRRHRAIITAITAMARSMRLGVIAEGVETVEQLRFLSSLGSEEIQGYVFSAAVPAVEFEKLLADSQTQWSGVLSGGLR